MSETLVQFKLPTHPLFATVLLENLEYRAEDAAELYEGVPFTGLVYDYDEKTKKLTEERSYWNGGLHGFIKQWYPSGQIRGECRYFHGDFYGELKEWNENGRLKRHGIYWGSYFPLWQKEWDTFGNLTNSYYIKDDEKKLNYYIHRKKSKRETLHLRANWASDRGPGLINFNKQIQIYLFDNPFIGIEPKRDIRDLKIPTII